MRNRHLLASAALILGSSPLRAQQFFTPGGEINGQIGVQVNVTLDDGIGDYNPVANLLLTLYRGATDSLQLRTDEAGVLRFAIAPGTYRLSSAASVNFHGREYRWNIPLVVERRMGIVNLTTHNSTVSATTNAPNRAPTPRATPGPADDNGGTRYYPKGKRPWESSAFPSGYGVNGLLLGLKFDGSAIRGDEGSTTPSGPGFTFQLGYGATRQLALLADVTAARVEADGETATLAHVDLLARYAFIGATRRAAPYLEGGYSGMGMAESGSGSTSDVTITGAGVTLGGGTQVFISPKAAFDLELKWTRGQFTTARVGDVTYNDLGSWTTSARFNIGMTFYPMARRSQD